MALSMDIREKVMKAIKGGMSRREAASRFDIGPATAVRWAKQVEITGEVAPLKMGGDRRSRRIEAYADFILAQIAAKRKRPVVAHRIGGVLAVHFGFLRALEDLRWRRNILRTRLGGRGGRSTSRRGAGAGSASLNIAFSTVSTRAHSDAGLERSAPPSPCITRGNRNGGVAPPGSACRSARLPSRRSGRCMSKR